MPSAVGVPLSTASVPLTVNDVPTGNVPAIKVADDRVTFVVTTMYDERAEPCVKLPGELIEVTAVAVNVPGAGVVVGVGVGVGVPVPVGVGVGVVVGVGVGEGVGVGVVTS